MRGQLRIGLHHDVEVTDVDGPPQPVVSQAFCSALAVAYGDIPKARWRGFASMVLEAAYEATLSGLPLPMRSGGRLGRCCSHWWVAALSAEPSPAVIELTQEFA